MPTELENRVRRPEGCTKLKVAKQTKTGDTYSYGKKERLYGLEEVAVTYTYAEGAAYSDNMQDTSIRRVSSADIEVQIRQLAPETEAKLMGKKFVNGIKVTNSKDIAPVWAVSWIQTNSDGSETHREFYNCTVSREEGTNTTVKDGIEYDVVTLKIKALPLVNGDVDIEFDNDAEGVSEEVLTKFESDVILSNAIPSGATLSKEGRENK